MAERLCVWCSEPWKKGHTCDKPAGFRPTVDQAGVPGRRGRARAYALTPLGWETAGYRWDGSRWSRPREV
jgi:hypothetical protein